jgi:DNA polymerase-3 subunit epsilon
MRDRLHAYLLERPSGATPRELIDLVFTHPGADMEFGPRFLRTLLGGDARFAFDERSGRWTATVHAALARALDDTAFVVVDLETTGGAPERGDRIIEIGALRLYGGQVVDRFNELVDPGRRLPSFISRLTGITDAMLTGRPGIEAVLARFVAFAAGSVLVAHNAAFDLAFLNVARLALSGEVFEQPHLCTLRLARRLVPQRRRSLDALAGHFGIPLVDRHRAFGDARITAEVLFHLLELLRRHGVARLDQLLDLQERAADGRRFSCLLPRARVASLPPAPGIYRFKDADGRLLYVGKAKNLRQRVGSYLSNSSAHRPKVLDLIRHIRDVDVEVTGSELEAALREAEEIRRCQPPYNRLNKHLPQIAFLRLGAGDPFPRLVVVRRLSGRAVRHFGPFRSLASARAAQALLARLFRLRTCSGRLRPTPVATPCLQGQIGACSAPCAARVDRDAYAQQVAAAERFFDGEIGAAGAELGRRRAAHSAAQRFEAAARVQRQLELVRRMRRRQRTFGWIVARQHFAVMQPAADGAGALLYAVVHGRLVERGTARAAADLAAFAARIAVRLREPPAGELAPQDVDGTVILAAWLRERGDRDGYVFPLDASSGVQGRLPEWAAALDSLLARGGAQAGAVELPASAHPEGERQQRDAGQVAGPGAVAGRAAAAGVGLHAETVAAHRP